MNDISLIEKTIQNLCKKSTHQVNLTGLNLSPSKIDYILTKNLGWERIDCDFNNPDVWYYYSKDSKQIGMYYCGFTFYIELFLNE